MYCTCDVLHILADSALRSSIKAFLGEKHMVPRHSSNSNYIRIYYNTKKMVSYSNTRIDESTGSYILAYGYTAFLVVERRPPIIGCIKSYGSAI